MTIMPPGRFQDEKKKIERNSLLDIEAHLDIIKSEKQF
jgi:hypothetical protein